MTVTRSRYLLVDGARYRDQHGHEVVLAYSTRRALLFGLAPETAARLMSRDGLAGIPPDQLATLVEYGAVVDEDEDELAQVLSGYRTTSADPGHRSFSFLPTSYCNMACDYCGQEHSKAGVDRSIVDRFGARVEAAIADDATRDVTVGWFGGEPLLGLRVMRELSTRFTAAADAYGKRYSARMPTNGSLLTRRTIQILHDECRLTWMDVTLDGPQPVHDARRLKRNGVGSFHRTVAVLAETVRDRIAPNLTIGIRVNVDRDNEDSVSDLIADLACFGLVAPQVELHLMPVHSWGNDVSAVELQARRFADLEIGWLEQARALGIRFPALPNVTKRSTCRATTRYSDLVDATGRVYSCSEHPLVPGVRESGVIARVEDLVGSAQRPVGAFDDWYDQVGDGSQQCGRCPLLPVCGGACPKQWREGGVPCPSIKHNWADRMRLAASQLGLQRAEAA